MTVEILSYDREREVYVILGYVHDGEWIQNDDAWTAPESFEVQLAGQGLLEDEDELVRRYDNPELRARKIDPAGRPLDPAANSPIDPKEISR